MSRRKNKDGKRAKAVSAPAGTAAPAHPPGSNRVFSEWIGRWLPGLLVVMATLLAYQQVWRAGLVWDDAAHVTRPELYPLHGLWRIWFEPGATQQYYPGLHSAFWLEHRLWGDSTAAYHAANVLLHLGAVALLYQTLRRLAVPGAFWAAAVFALHPVCVESVAWISEQKNTLSTVFYFAAALAYLNFDGSRRARWYAAATGLFAAALTVKTVTATLPAALLVVFWWKRGRLKGRGDVLPLLPWFALSAGAGVMTAWMERTSVGATGAAYSLALVERCLVAGRAVWFYLGKLIAPFDLMFIYPRWDIDVRAAGQYLFPVALVLGLGVLFALRARARGPLAAALLFVGTLSPALGFINVFPFAYSFVADHFQYLAAALLIPALVAGCALGGSRLPRPGRIAAQFAAAAFVATLGGLTWRQTAMYADADTLWRVTIDRNPRCWLALNNLGADLLQAGRLEEAVPLVERAVELAPANAAGHTNLGTARQMQGRWPEAVAQFQQTVGLQNDSADAHTNLGFALLQVGRTDESLVQLQQALALNPNLAKAHLTLGNLLLQTGHVDEALARYRHAVTIDPGDVEARTNFGTALAQEGKLDEAIAEFQQALLIEPKSAAAHLNLGNALLQQGRLDAAIAHFQRALEFDPKSALTHNNLGLALLQNARFDEAAAQFERALALNPDYVEAHQNLGTAYFKLGRLDEAKAQFQMAGKLK
jgi:tetratricopeptide (TPR) repeat protein